MKNLSLKSKKRAKARAMQKFSAQSLGRAGVPSSAIGRAANGAAGLLTGSRVASLHQLTFAVSYEMGKAFGTWAYGQLHAPIPPKPIPATAVTPLISPPVRGRLDPAGQGWENISGCPTALAGINDAASGSSACVGKRSVFAHNWRANEGKFALNGPTTYAFDTYGQFLGFRWNTSHTQEYADYEGSGRWRMVQLASQPAPQAPYLAGRPAVALPDPALAPLPKYQGALQYVSPMYTPINPSLMPEPWSPSYRQQPQFNRAYDPYSPPQQQRQHSYQAQPLYIGQPPYNPRPKPQQEVEPSRPPRPSEVLPDFPPILIDSGSGVRVDAGSNLKLKWGSYHSNQPPKKNEREVKVKYRSAIGRINSLSSLATTAEELLDIFYDGVPFKDRPRYGNTKWVKRDPTLLEKVQSVYRNWDKIDWADMSRRVYAEDTAEDTVIGLLQSGSVENLLDMGVNPTALSNALRGQRGNIKAAKYQERIRVYEEKKARDKERKEWLDSYHDNRRSGGSHDTFKKDKPKWFR